MFATSTPLTRIIKHIFQIYFVRSVEVPTTKGIGKSYKNSFKFELKNLSGFIAQLGGKPTINPLV